MLLFVGRFWMRRDVHRYVEIVLMADKKTYIWAENIVIQTVNFFKEKKQGLLSFSLLKINIVPHFVWFNNQQRHLWSRSQNYHVTLLHVWLFVSLCLCYAWANKNSWAFKVITRRSFRTFTLECNGMQSDLNRQLEQPTYSYTSKAYRTFDRWPFEWHTTKFASFHSTTVVSLCSWCMCAFYMYATYEFDRCTIYECCWLIGGLWGKTGFL